MCLIEKKRSAKSLKKCAIQILKMTSSEKILIDKKWAWQKRHHDREKSPFENKSWVGESEKVGLDLENIT